MTAADRFAAGLQATWGLLVAFVLLLGIAYLIGRAYETARRRRASRRLPLFTSDLMAPWADREPGDLDV